MQLNIRITVNKERREKLDRIDGVVDANKTKIRQRLMDEAIDNFYDSLFKPSDIAKTLKGPTNE